LIGNNLDPGTGGTTANPGHNDILACRYVHHDEITLTVGAGPHASVMAAALMIQGMQHDHGAGDRIAAWSLNMTDNDADFTIVTAPASTPALLQLKPYTGGFVVYNLDLFMGASKILGTSGDHVVAFRNTRKFEYSALVGLGTSPEAAIAVSTAPHLMYHDMRAFNRVVVSVDDLTHNRTLRQGALGAEAYSDHSREYGH